MPSNPNRNAHKHEYTISKLFISDYEKFQQGLRKILGEGPNHETTWGFREDNAEVRIVALVPGLEDLLKELQEFGYVEKEEMAQKASGSMKNYYRKRSQSSIKSPRMERINDNGEPYYTHIIPFDLVTDKSKLRTVLGDIYPTPEGKLKGFEICQYGVGDDYNVITWAKDPQDLVEEVKKKDDNGLKKD
ncbi:hypothetical protein ACHAPQ_007992 [Fusarium lateritium]